MSLLKPKPKSHRTRKAPCFVFFFNLFIFNMAASPTSMDLESWEASPAWLDLREITSLPQKFQDDRSAGICLFEDVYLTMSWSLWNSRFKKDEWWQEVYCIILTAAAVIKRNKVYEHHDFLKCLCQCLTIYQLDPHCPEAINHGETLTTMLKLPFGVDTTNIKLIVFHIHQKLTSINRTT